MPYIGKSPEFGVRERFYFTQTSAGATSISGFDDNGTPLRFTDGNYVDVYLNGVLLVDGVDYGTSTANTISSLSALADEDVIEVVAYDVFNIAKNNAEVTRTRYYKTASGSETTISGNDDSGVAISFPAGAQIDVSLNGVSLVAGTDYNTNTANTISGLSSLSAGQVIEIVKYEKFVVSDTVSKAAGGAFGGAISATSFSGGGLGKILQVVSATKTNKQSTSSSTAVDIAGLSVSITPSSSSNKMLVRCDINYGGINNVYLAFFVKRNSANMVVSTAGTGNQVNATFSAGGDNNNHTYKVNGVSHAFLDSPSTTSAITYKLQFASTGTSGPATINAPYNTDNAAYVVGGTSTITVMEISA